MRGNKAMKKKAQIKNKRVEHAQLLRSVGKHTY